VHHSGSACSPAAATCVLRRLIAALLLLQLLRRRRMVAPVPAVIPPGIILPMVCSRNMTHLVTSVYAPITRSHMLAPACSIAAASTAQQPVAP
jgi:hypothetical protein